jgi:hypothetical protein
MRDRALSNLLDLELPQRQADVDLDPVIPDAGCSQGRQLRVEVLASSAYPRVSENHCHIGDCLTYHRH